MTDEVKTEIKDESTSQIDTLDEVLTTEELTKKLSLRNEDLGLNDIDDIVGLSLEELENLQQMNLSLPAEVETILQKVFPSNHPLDDPNFDPVIFINQQFPDEMSLGDPNDGPLAQFIARTQSFDH